MKSDNCQISPKVLDLPQKGMCPSIKISRVLDCEFWGLKYLLCRRRLPCQTPMQNIFWGLETKIWREKKTQISASRNRCKNEGLPQEDYGVTGINNCLLVFQTRRCRVSICNISNWSNSNSLKIFEFDQFELFYISRYIYNVIHTYVQYTLYPNKIYFHFLSVLYLYTTITMILIIISSSKIAIFKFGISHLSGKFKCSC